METAIAITMIVVDLSWGVVVVYNRYKCGDNCMARVILRPSDREIYYGTLVSNGNDLTYGINVARVTEVTWHAADAPQIVDFLRMDMEQFVHSGADSRTVADRDFPSTTPFLIV